MTKAEVLEALKQMTTEERLEIIEIASQLLRAELATKFTPQVERHLSLAVASEVMRSYYEQGSELTVFTDSNIEDFYEYEDYA